LGGSTILRRARCPTAISGSPTVAEWTLATADPLKSIKRKSYMFFSSDTDNKSKNEDQDNEGDNTPDLGSATSSGLSLTPLQTTTSPYSNSERLRRKHGIHQTYLLQSYRNLKDLGSSGTIRWSDVKERPDEEDEGEDGEDEEEEPEKRLSFEDSDYTLSLVRQWANP